jgi:hypothetical protein
MFTCSQHCIVGCLSTPGGGGGGIAKSLPTPGGDGGEGVTIVGSLPTPGEVGRVEVYVLHGRGGGGCGGFD